MNEPGRVRIFSFADGFAWFRTSVRLLRSQAFPLLLMGLLLQFLGGFSQVGVLGLLFVIAVPALTAGMLQGMHMASRGQRPPVLQLFAAFQVKGRILPLFALGALTIAVGMIVTGFVMVGSVQELDPELLQRIQAGDPDAVAELDPALLLRTMMGLAAGLLLGACLSFYAVPLIWFRGDGLGRALGDGLVAMFRQWRALTALGLMLAAVGFPVAMLAGSLLSLQMMSNTPSVLSTLLMLSVLVIYQVLVFACQYVAFRAVFAVAPAPTVDGDTSEGDQLIA